MRLFKHRQDAPGEDASSEPEYRLVIESSPPGYISAYMWSLYAPDGRLVVSRNFAATQPLCRREARQAKRKDMGERVRLVEAV